MSEEQLRPETERIGGGISARLAAATAVGLLGGVVWIGVSGRSDAPGPTSTPPPVAQASVPPAPAASPLASPTPAPTPVYTPGLVERPLGSQLPVTPRRHGPLGEDAFAVTLWLKDRFYLNVLHDVSDGHLAAVMRMPLYSEMPTTSVQLIQLWTREDRPSLAQVGSHDLPLAPLLSSEPPDTLLEAVVEARPRKRAQPRLVREGYTLSVSADARDDHAYLVYDLRVGDAPPVDTGTDRLQRITRGWRDFGRRLPGRAPYEKAIEQQEGRSPPLIRLVAQPGTPRGTMILGYSWVAGY